MAIASTGCRLVLADVEYLPCIAGKSSAKQSNGMVTFVSGRFALMLELLMLLLQLAVSRCMLTGV